MNIKAITKGKYFLLKLKYFELGVGLAFLALGLWLHHQTDTDLSILLPVGGVLLIHSLFLPDRVDNNDGESAPAETQLNKD